MTKYHKGQVFSYSSEGREVQGLDTSKFTIWEWHTFKQQSLVGQNIIQLNKLEIYYFCYLKLGNKAKS